MKYLKLFLPIFLSSHIYSAFTLVNNVSGPLDVEFGTLVPTGIGGIMQWQQIGGAISIQQNTAPSLTPPQGATYYSVIQTQGLPLWSILPRFTGWLPLPQPNGTVTCYVPNNVSDMTLICR